MENNNYKNWLKSLNNSDIENFIENNFDIEYRDYTFQKVIIKGKMLVKIYLYGKHNFPSEMCGNRFMEEEFYFDEYFIKSESEKVNNHPFKFFKLQADNNKILFAWHRLLATKNTFNIINNFSYIQNLQKALNSSITNYYEYMCNAFVKKYLHSDGTILSKTAPKYLYDEEKCFVALNDLKTNFLKERKLLKKYIKNLNNFLGAKYEK